MFIRKTAAAILGLSLLGAPALLAPLPASAKQMCGMETTFDGLRAGANAEGFSSTCLAGKGCAIFSAAVDGHRLQLAREEGDETWIILLNIPAGADVSEGVELTAGSGEPMRIPPEFLDERASGRAIAISAKLTDVVLEEVKKAGTLKWRYVLKGGKQADVSIPLKGLAGMIDWAGCAAKTLGAEKKGKGD